MTPTIASNGTRKTLTARPRIPSLLRYWATTAVLIFGFAGLGLSGAAGAQTPGNKLYDTTKVAEGVYTFRFAIHRNMFIVTRAGVIVTDPINPRAAKILMSEISKVTEQSVKYVIYSHEHWDHISGGKIFKDAGASFISHVNCLAAFNRRPNPALVIPDRPYSGSRHDVKLGGRTLELHHFGLGHGRCMTVMRLAKEKILFIVDIVTPYRVAFTYMPDIIPGEVVRTLRAVEKLDFVKIVPGHGPATAPASAVRQQREYLEDLIAAVAVAMKTERNPFKIMRTLKLPKYEKWGFYNEWLPMNILRIYMYHRLGK